MWLDLYLKVTTETYDSVVISAAQERQHIFFLTTYKFTVSEGTLGLGYWL